MVEGIPWLLLPMLMQVFYEKGQWVRKKHNVYILKSRKILQRLSITLQSGIEISISKDRPALPKGTKGMVPSEQDSAHLSFLSARQR